jgi:hypothetical protein
MQVQYQPPYGPPGAIDPNASYINGDPTIGRQGSVPPAAAFEFPQREIVNLIGNSQQVPTDQDLNQMTRAVRDGKLIYCFDSGPLNTVQVVNLTPPITTYTQGLTLHVLIAHTITGPTTIAIGNINPTAIKRRDGAELQANDMVTGQIATLVCDGTYFQLQNMGADGAVGGTTTLHNVDIPYVHDTGALDPNWTDPKQVTKNHVIGLYSPVLPDIKEGRTVEVKLDQVIQGPTDFAPNNFPIHPVAHPDGSPIVAGDGVPNQIWLLVFDSVQWQLLDVFNSGAQPGPAPTPKAYDGRSLQLAAPGSTPWVANNAQPMLTRSPSLNTNRQVFTISSFLKTPVPPNDGLYGGGDYLFSAGDEGGAWWGCSMNWFGIAPVADFTGNQIVNVWWNNSGGQVAGIGGPQSYTGTTNGYYTSGVFVDNNWHHLLITADGATISIYLDGILKSKGNVSGNAPWNSTLHNVIGAIWSCSGANYPGGNYGAGYYGVARFRYAEVINLDGTAIGDYTKFAQAKNGILVPNDPTDILKLPFGPNGFYLNWQNAVDMTTTGLGKDASPAGNNWQPMNLDSSHVQTDFPGKQQA